MPVYIVRKGKNAIGMVWCKFVESGRWSGWVSGVDTPLTVMTTRAPAVLKTQHYAFCFFQYFVFRTKPHIHTLKESIYLLNFRVNVRRIVWRLQIWFNVMNEKLITSTLTHFFLCLHHLILPADPAKPIQKAALWKIFYIFKQFVPSSLIIYSLSLLAGCSKKRGNRKLDMTTQSNRHSLSFLTLSLFGVF